MREQQREQWAREDSLRTFEQRRICYLEFEEQLRSTALAVSYAQSGFSSALEDEWQVPVFQSLLRLQVFSTPEATQAASDAYDALLRWGGVDGINYPGAEADYDKAHDRYLAIIRKDLRVDNGNEADNK